MTRKEAIKYLQDIADNATLPPYQQALRIALDDMERADALESIVVKQGEMNLRLIGKGGR